MNTALPSLAVRLSPGRLHPSSFILQPSRARRRAKLLPAGTGHVQIFGRAPGPFTVAWREEERGPRHRTTRRTWKLAKAFAHAKQVELANRATGQAQLTPADAASFLRCQEIIAQAMQRSPGAPVPSLELVCSEWSHLTLSLGRGLAEGESVSLAQVLQYYLENRPRNFTPLPMPDLVEAFLLEKTAEICPAWHVALAQQLRRFAAWTNRPLHTLAAQDLNTWLRSLKGKNGSPVGARTRANYRAGLEQLVHWSQTNHYVPRAWSELEHVLQPAPCPAEVRTLSPEELAKLLSVRAHAEEHGRASAGFVQLLALQAFAGLRHAESCRLNWRDVHLEERYIYVPAQIAKTGRDRVVPIADNLAAWLAPAIRPSGPVCPIAQTSGALTKAKKAAGLPAARNESRNILRKSFISYRLAVTHNITQVAEEAGNSPSVIRSNYKRPIPESEGRRWFNLWPTAADVIQLQFRL